MSDNEEVKGLMDGLFKGMNRDKNEKPDLVSEQQHKNQDRIRKEHKKCKEIGSFPGVGLDFDTEHDLYPGTGFDVLAICGGCDLRENVEKIKEVIENDFALVQDSIPSGDDPL